MPEKKYIGIKIKIFFVVILYLAYLICIPKFTFPQIFNHKSGTSTIEHVRFQLKAGDNPNLVLSTRLENIKLQPSTMLDNIQISIKDLSNVLHVLSPSDTTPPQLYNGTFITFTNNQNLTPFNINAINSETYTKTKLLQPDNLNANTTYAASDINKTTAIPEYTTNCSYAFLESPGPYTLTPPNDTIYVSAVIQVNSNTYYQPTMPKLTTNYPIEATIDFDLVNPPIPLKTQIVPIIGLFVMSIISGISFYYLRKNVIESSYGYDSKFINIDTYFLIGTIAYIFFSAIGFFLAILILLKNIYIPSLAIDTVFVITPIHFFIGMYIFWYLLI